MIKNKETPTKVVKALNAWQIYTNPLRYMTKPQLDQMFDYQRHGNDARLQIAFYEMERTMPIYGVCLSKRLCAIHDKKWRINPTNPSDPSSIQQAKKVHKIFEESDTLNDDGLTEAIRHLGLASFRGRSVVKAFIEDNHLIFKKIENEAAKEVDVKYFDELVAIESQLEKRGKESVSKDDKKKLNARKKKIEEDKALEIRRIVKDKFDYEIPVAEIQKAGISSIGAPIDNELIPLAEEYTPYRKENHLWDVLTKEIKYNMVENDKIYRVRIVNGKVAEPEVFYG